MFFILNQFHIRLHVIDIFWFCIFAPSEMNLRIFGTERIKAFCERVNFTFVYRYVARNSIIVVNSSLNSISLAWELLFFLHCCTLVVLRFCNMNITGTLYPSFYFTLSLIPLCRVVVIIPMA